MSKIEKQDDFHLTIAEIKKKDYPQLKELMDRVYVNLGGSWSKTTISTLIDAFLKGKLLYLTTISSSVSCSPCALIMPSFPTRILTMI